jgi:hypothetical protein
MKKGVEHERAVITMNNKISNEKLATVNQVIREIQQTTQQKNQP